MSYKNILVTGGSGFLGSALVVSLVSDGHNVRVFDNNFRGKLTRLDKIKNDIEFITGDIRDERAVNQASKGVDWIFHLAFVNGTKFFYEQPGLVLDVGVKGALTTMDAALKNNVEKYIVASSSEVYNEPINIPTDENERILIPDINNPRFSYSGGKFVTELLTIHYLKHGPERIIFRPHNVYGPNMGWEHVIPDFFKRIRNLRKYQNAKPFDFPIQGSGNETRAFCYISDAVEGIKICTNLGKSGEIYNIGFDKETSIFSLAKHIAKICGCEINIIKTAVLKGSTSRRCPNIDKLAKLGFTPKTDLNVGLQECANWYLNADLPKD